MRSSSLFKHVVPLLNRTCQRYVAARVQQNFRLRDEPVLPVIDFASFATDNENNDHPRETIDKLANACEHVGFFYAIGHGISNELLTRTLTVTREFFNLNVDIKNRYAARRFSSQSIVDNQNGGFGRGYQSIGENVTNTKRDRHEGFDLYRELDLNHPLRRQFDKSNSHSKDLPDYRELATGWNPWPYEFPQFQTTINEYTVAMLQAGQRVMRAIALSLNLPLNHFQSTFDDSFWVIRCINYPAISPSDNEANRYGEGCGEHSDYGWLTFVNQDLDSRNCLHVRTNDTAQATYVSADPIVIEEQIALTCNIGDILSFVTQNRYRSTRHRVISPIEPARSRISVPFFLEPNLDVKLHTNATSPECFYGEYLTNKVRTNFQFYNDQQNNSM